MICQKCKEDKPKTLHHVLPRRFYKNQHRNPKVALCRECHDELEKLIPFRQRPRDFYFQVVMDFLGIKLIY